MEKKINQAIFFAAYHLEALEYHKLKLIQDSGLTFSKGMKDGLDKGQVYALHKKISEFIFQIENRKYYAINFLKRVNEVETNKGVAKRKKENKSAENLFRKKSKSKFSAEFFSGEKFVKTLEAI